MLTRPPNPAGQGRAGHRFESCHLSCGSSCGYRMMGITKQKFGNEYEMSIYELFHYSLFPGLFVAFTYNKKQPPAFGAAPAFWCILLSFLGLSFRHIPNNLSNYNVLTANAPFFYQISGTWSNHEGSILSWCRIPSFYGFLLCYRGRPQSHNVSKRGGHRETFFYSFVSNFVKNSILSLPRYEQKSGAAPQLYTPFVLRTLVDSELRSRRNRTFDGPALFYAPLSLKGKLALLLWALGAPMVREKEKGLILCIWHEMIKRELRLSMNSGLTELLALLCFSLLSYQRVPILLFEISSFVPNRLQNQILFHKILYQLYILLAFMPETSPVLWALAYVDQK